MRAGLHLIGIFLVGSALSLTSLAQTSDTIEVTPKGEGFSPDSPVGSYKQPQWTAARPFTNSRVYVLKEHQIEVELWAKIQKFHDSDNDQNLFQQEIEYGFYRHLQFDFYVNEHNFYNPDKGARRNCAGRWPTGACCGATRPFISNTTR